MENVTKRFGKVVANNAINLELREGEILSLLGENGSGKTTLMNMLSGIYFPDEGQIYIHGKPVTIASPKDAFNYGIGMIHQHFKLVDVFTATENIVLGLEGKLDLAEAGKKVREICDKYGFDIDPNQKIYDMSVSQKQTVEIVKVLFRGADILILDEPTAVLTPQETDKLFQIMRNMKADGSGTPYKTGDKIPMTGSVILYAQWTRNSSRDDDDDKYFFAIQKVDAQDGHALNGAKFKLYQLDKNDRIVNRRVVETRQQSSKNGIALFGVEDKNSYDGIWYYAEVSAPEGYVLDNTEHKIKATDFFDSLSTAVKYADTVRNYRGTTPDLLNDSDHFAYVIGYMDGNVRPYGLISRAETTTIFFRLLKDSVRDGNLLTSNTYTDVADDYWANTAISTMTGLGIVQGRSATTFDPKAPITRAQFAAICARFDTGKSSGEQTFSDISGHWAEKYIQRAAELGWIKGFEDGTFRPDTYITRAQAMTMINRVLNRIPEENSDLLPGMNVWPDCSPGDWFYLAVQEATNSHDYKHKAGNYETWTKLMKNPDWTRYEN